MFVKDHGTTLGNYVVITTCGNFGKNQLLTCIDKHVPLKTKRTGKKKSPCIIYKLIGKIRKRDFLKKKAERTKDQSYWADFKTSRNK